MAFRALVLWRGREDSTGTPSRPGVHFVTTPASAFLVAPYRHVLQVTQGSLCVRYLKMASRYSSVLPATGDTSLM